MITTMAAETAGIYTADLPSLGFKVYELQETVNPGPVRGRRDFYKIVLATGDLTIHTGGKPSTPKAPFCF